MVILDTDRISLLEWQASPLGQKLLARISKVPADQVAVSIISFEEQFRGWMTRLRKAKTVVEEVRVYDHMLRQLRHYSGMQILGFEEPAAVEFQRLKKLKLGVASMDLKIAAVALSHRATVVSRNTRDFSRVPGLLLEDWTKES